jgi:hypothetical protein
MTALTELSAAYHNINARREDLDQRIIALPNDDIAGKDTMMIELEAEVARFADVVAEMTVTRAINMADLRIKAAVLMTMRDRDASEVIRFALSLADDIVNLPTVDDPG